MGRKRILITGAAGFLGSHLCDRFIKEGYHVIGMDNLITGNLDNIAHLFKEEHFDFYHHDVSKFVHDCPGIVFGDGELVKSHYFGSKRKRMKGGAYLTCKNP